jgi:hypothetical protein
VNTENDDEIFTLAQLTRERETKEREQTTLRSTCSM